MGLSYSAERLEIVMEIRDRDLRTLLFSLTTLTIHRGVMNGLLSLGLGLDRGFDRLAAVW